jgi:hypothetical protein
LRETTEHNLAVLQSRIATQFGEQLGHLFIPLVQQLGAVVPQVTDFSGGDHFLEPQHVDRPPRAGIVITIQIELDWRRRKDHSYPIQPAAPLMHKLRRHRHQIGSRSAESMEQHHRRAESLVTARRIDDCAVQFAKRLTPLLHVYTRSP